MGILNDVKTAAKQPLPERIDRECWGYGVTPDNKLVYFNGTSSSDLNDDAMVGVLPIVTEEERADVEAWFEEEESPPVGG